MRLRFLGSLLASFLFVLLALPMGAAALQTCADQGLNCDGAYNIGFSDARKLSAMFLVEDSDVVAWMFVGFSPSVLAWELAPHVPWGSDDIGPVSLGGVVKFGDSALSLGTDGSYTFMGRADLRGRYRSAAKPSDAIPEPTAALVFVLGLAVLHPAIRRR